MLEIVFSSGAWATSASAIAAAAVIAAVILLRDFLRLESLARSLQSENELLHHEFRSLTSAPPDRDPLAGRGQSRVSRPVPGQRRGSNAPASPPCSTGPVQSRFVSAVESVRQTS